MCTKDNFQGAVLHPTDVWTEGLRIPLAVKATPRGEPSITVRRMTPYLCGCGPTKHVSPPLSSDQGRIDKFATG